MNSVRIVADSGCDLPPALAEKYQITIIPVLVRFGQEMVPSDQLTNDEFWQRVANSSEPPGTSSAAPGKFLHAFQELVDVGHDVVCLTLPGKHSGTFNAAVAGRQGVRRSCACGGHGLIFAGHGVQALEVARQALAGRSVDFVQRTAESLRTRTSIIFVLDTLEWVRRGGRLDLIIPLIDRVDTHPARETHP